MSSKIVVRAALPADLDQLLALTRNTPDAPNWTAAQYKEVFAPRTHPEAPRAIFVAMKHEAVVAFCVIAVAADEGELENMVVGAGFRREGVGTMMCIEALRWAFLHGAQQVWLEVRKSSVPAIGLYRTVGFQEAGLRKGYYKDPVEDALLMRAAVNAATCLQ